MLSRPELWHLEELVDTSRVAARIELVLPAGGRPRQLLVRTLLIAMLATQADHRPAHLTRVHQALMALDHGDKVRLGVIATWRHGPHLLTYRQVERTFHLVVTALSKPIPDGSPSEHLSAVVDALLESSVPERYKTSSGSLAVDWSDLESYSCPPSEQGGACADREASWGRRKSDQPGVKDELFFGYELQAATMVPDEAGHAVPELARRIGLSTCAIDPPPAFVPVLTAMVASGVAVSDVLSDSGYAHRKGEHWAAPLRRLGASIVTDLHPQDRGPRGTAKGATICNGNLYCPATPRMLLELGPLARSATADETAAHDRKCAELAAYKLGRFSSDDADGYHRVACPAAMGKVRCPLWPKSMALSHTRPEVLTPPEHRLECCAQKTITVAPEVHLKTAQKHDYPSKAHRDSYARRTAVERTFSSVKDPASNDIARGWCRVMSLAPITLFVACLFVVRNERIIDAFETRQAEQERRLKAGLPPRTWRRRRRTLGDLVASPTANAPPKVSTT